VLEQQPMLLSTLPPSRGQERLALIAGLLLLAAFLLAVPFAHVQLGPIVAFVPIVATVMFVNDTITSALLFAQFAVLRSYALLVLANGFLFTGLLMIPQSTGSFFISWHFGLPAITIIYALLKDAEPAKLVAQGSVRIAILASTIGVIGFAIGLTWLVAVYHDVLPPALRDVVRTNPLWSYAVAPMTLLMCVIAIVLLSARRRSVLDLWLLAVSCAWLLGSLLLILIGERFSVAWYGNRVFAALSATFVLLVLLWESTMMYARLARLVIEQRREREQRLMSMDAVAASIAHEVNQPLGAIAMNSAAGLRWLEKTPPDLEEARAALQRMTSDSHRASKVIESIRAMFRPSSRERVALSINESILEAIAHVRDNLQAERVSVQLELASRLPPVLGDKGQLQQVILNIITNAAEAMSQVSEQDRVLCIRSAELEEGGVQVSITDSGPGIDPKDLGRIFDAFYTTKRDGMGMGLAISQSIIRAHGGLLSASAGDPRGTVFRFVLPGYPQSGDR
jgi:signal transduction histidine kinase